MVAGDGPELCQPMNKKEKWNIFLAKLWSTENSHASLLET